MIPKGYAVVDMDHLEDENVPQQIGTLIPSYMEVSPSGEGRHIVAKVDTAAIPTEGGKLAPSYYVKNPHNHLELYIGGLTNRYMTFTGNSVKDIAVVDCTQGILAFLEKYMKRENFRKYPSVVDEEEAKKLSDMEII